MKSIYFYRRLLTFSSLILFNTINSSSLYAAQKFQFNSPQLKISLTPRTPEQIGAFYEGRGFSKAMINILKQQCFLTVIIKNKSRNILWHDLSNWNFTSSNKNILRYNRAYWKNKWQKMHIPLAHQSTFRWTLLPESLDFRSNEAEGGNIILPYTNTPVTLRAVFKAKADNSGKPVNIKINNIRCAKH